MGQEVKCKPLKKVLFRCKYFPEPELNSFIPKLNIWAFPSSSNSSILYSGETTILEHQGCGFMSSWSDLTSTCQRVVEETCYSFFLLPKKKACSLLCIDCTACWACEMIHFLNQVAGFTFVCEMCWWVEVLQFPEESYKLLNWIKRNRERKR